MAKDRLTELIQSGDYVLFLGAGFSKESGGPLWNEALIEIANRLEPHEKLYSALIKYEAQRENYLVAAQQLYLAPIAPMIRTQILQEVFGREGQITNRQKRLLRSPCQGFITTNFDRTLERAVREAGIDSISFTESDVDLPQARVCERRFSVRLHGRIESPEGLVFSQNQYEAARARKEYQEFFREIFVSRNVIFFGFSFVDPLIAEHIEKMSLAVHSMFKRKAYALFSSAPSGRLDNLLKEAGITAVVYDPTDRHAEGWNLLVSSPAGRPAPSVDDFQARWVRSELAAVYARARSRGNTLDRTQVTAGLLTSFLRSLGAGSEHTVEAFEIRARRYLALPDSVPRTELTDAIARLDHDGLIRITDNTVQVLSIGELDVFNTDLAALTTGLLARAAVRYDLRIESTDREAVTEFLTAILVVNGLHVAHSFIRRQPLSELDLAESISKASKLVTLPAILRDPSFTSALIHFLTHPDEGEERLLSDLAHLAFSTSLMVVDPILSSTLRSTATPTIYLDASVVLPWIAEGHPLQPTYSRIIASLGRGKRLVIREYVNELVSHKRLALETVEQGDLRDPARFDRYVMMFEPGRINAYLGGYSSLKAGGYGGTFVDYLTKYVPFDTEAEASIFLKGKDLIVLDVPAPRSVEGGPLFGGLKAALTERRKERTDLVIEHDTKQLELMMAHRPKSECPYFITADKTLLSSVADTAAKVVLNRVLLPQQAAYLADYVEGSAGTIPGFTRALWSAPKDLRGRVRDYYTDRVLKEYEFALVGELAKIVDGVMVEVEKETALNNWRDTEPDRIALFRTLDRFENKFYERMDDAKRRLGLKPAESK